jgi:hypothetical protein
MFGIRMSTPALRHRWRATIAAFVVVAVVPLVVAASASGFTDYTSFDTYCANCAVYFNQGKVTGLNYRTDNGACRYDGGGWENVVYMNSSFQVVVSTGSIYTACDGPGISYIFNNGYYRSGCLNTNYETQLMYCVTWNYTP